jgi:hypothetical protein
MKILLVGTVRNCSKTVESDFDRISSALSAVGEVAGFLVESDSSDSTRSVLSNMAKTRDFEFSSQGELLARYPDRIERIRYCRNVYVDYIRRNQSQAKWDLVCVADFDGINNQINQNSILAAVQDIDCWDVCTANQRYRYYDLYALRHPIWNPSDVFAELDWYRQRKRFTHIALIDWFIEQKIRKDVLYRKMIRINPNSETISVDSAFGGFAIYKTSIFETFDYTPVKHGHQCEHVDLHLKLKENNMKIVIHPRMINSVFTPYTLNAFFVIRLLRAFRKLFSLFPKSQLN